MENQRAVTDSHLVKFDEPGGAIVWSHSFPSDNKNRESAIESIIQSLSNGLLISGVKNSKSGTLEGFKSYGKPVTGNAYIMFVEEKN